MTRVDPRSDIGVAADRLIDACAGAGCIRFEPDDALAAGVRAIANIYDRAADAPRRKPRRKH